MTSIIAKRRAVHRQLDEQRKHNEALAKEALRLEGLANLGSATAMIAHEINNLLTPLVNYGELALQDPEDAELAERALRKTVQNCRQAARVMESILALANGESEERVETPLLPLIEGVFECLCRDFRKDSIAVELRVDNRLRVWAVPVQLQQMLMNLILNARDAMRPHGGKLTIEAVDTANGVRITVSDTGCGIDKAEIARVFDSFFTTKGKNRDGGAEGSGLGLAFCKRVVDAHDGSITVESTRETGTTFTVVLPKK